MNIIEHNFYELKMNQSEFNTIRSLIAEGLTVTEEVTQEMTQVAESFGIRTAAEAPAEKLAARIRKQKTPQLTAGEEE